MDFAVFIKAPKSFQVQYCQLVNKMQQPKDQEAPTTITFYPTGPSPRDDVLFVDECAYMPMEFFHEVVVPLTEQEEEQWCRSQPQRRGRFGKSRTLEFLMQAVGLIHQWQISIMSNPAFWQLVRLYENQKKLCAAADSSNIQ